jgi:hypothetical protein
VKNFPEGKSDRLTASFKSDSAIVLLNYRKMTSDRSDEHLMEKYRRDSLTCDRKMAPTYTILFILLYFLLL